MNIAFFVICLFITCLYDCRQPNTAGKKPSQQGGTKPGFSNLTKDELEKEYQWQKFSVERKIKKV